MSFFDVAIIGAGPAGIAAALSLEKLGLSVALLERAPLQSLAEAAFDGREIALTHGSVSILKESGAWHNIPFEAISPLKAAHVENGHERGDMPLVFTPERHKTGELGFLVSNHLIRRALFKVAHEREAISFITGVSVDDIDIQPDMAHITYNGDKKLRTTLVIAADGRFSQTRQKQGIGSVMHDFHRSMLVCRMEHEQPHNHIALQWFDMGQTIALLPINGNASSVVISLPPEEIGGLLAMSSEDFSADLTRRTRERMGRMTLTSTRHAYPLKCIYAHRFRAHRLALIGDAAVGMHPITAHGFNLGLKGQALLCQAIDQALQRGESDPGTRKILRSFEQRHRLATAPLFAATNGIATLYTREEPPFRLLRKAGLRVANRLSPFKTLVTRNLTDRNTPLRPVQQGR